MDYCTEDCVDQSLERKNRLRHKISLTQELADLLRKYDVDTYCSENATLLAIELVSTIQDKARVSIHQPKKI